MTAQRRTLRFVLATNVIIWTVVLARVAFAQATVVGPTPNDPALATLDAVVCGMALLAVTLLLAGALDLWRRR